MPDLPRLRFKDSLTREPNLPRGFPILGNLENRWSSIMVKWYNNAKSFAHGSAERKAANFATSGCSLCYTCGTVLDKYLPACNTCKIPYHPIIDQARIQMHTSDMLQDKTWRGKATLTVYQYLKGCRETIERIEKRRSDNEITHEQKWAEIATLMQVHNELVDLSCYDPGNVPAILREFLSQGVVEGASAKAVAERGTLHSWGQTMQYSVNVNRQVEWYASHCWFSRFAQTDKFMKHGCNNRAQAKARVSHLVAAIWDLKKKKDLLVDTLQKATYPYVIEKTMPAKLMQVYNAYAHDVQGSTYREMVQKKKPAYVSPMLDAFISQWPSC